MDGQVHSYDRAKSLGILPGSHTLDKRTLRRIHTLIILGLCLLAGCLPISILNPGSHHFVHYVQYAITHGLLRLFWMFFFERYNKHIKGLVRDVSHPDANLSKTATQDAAMNYVSASCNEEYSVYSDPHHMCVLSVPKRRWYATNKEICDLRHFGLSVDNFSVQCFAVAHIMGVHFRAREWDCHPRCGSVVTCVVKGEDGIFESVYARVDKFLSVAGDTRPGYASVRWFGKPTYPTGTPLVVKVSDDGSDIASVHGCIVPITQIDPSRVMVEYDRVPNTYYVMRDSGWDVMKKT